MKEYVLVLLAGWMLSSCSTATEVSELSSVQGQWELVAFEPGPSIPNPDRYTIAFDADGRFNSRADCNQCFGGYETAGNAINLGPGIGCTRAFCQPPSLFDEYVAALGSVSAFARTGGQLRRRYAGGELVYRVSN